MELEEIEQKLEDLEEILGHAVHKLTALYKACNLGDFEEKWFMKNWKYFFKRMNEGCFE